MWSRPVWARKVFLNSRNRIRNLISSLTLAITVILILFGLGRKGVLSSYQESLQTTKLLDVGSASAVASEDNTDATLASCRYGVAAGEAQVDVITSLGTGVFYKFDYPVWVGPQPQNRAEQLHMIRVTQKKTPSGEYLPGYKTSVPLDSELAKFVRQNPGKLWMIGNEIERGPDPGKITTAQGDIYPQVYAVAYHDLYNFIKANDPTARVTIGGMIEPTPMRLQYLDIVWDTYLAKYGDSLPVDVWNIHLYPLSEVKSDGKPNNIANVALGTDPALGKRMADSASDCPDPDVYCYAEHDDLSIIIEHLIAFRQWMKEHGQQHKPLLISEYGIVFPTWNVDEYENQFSNTRARLFLQESLDTLLKQRDPDLGYNLDDHRLAQQVIWFSAYHKRGFSSNLAAEGTGSKLSALGEAYRDGIASEAPYVNLLLERVGPTSVRKNASGSYDINLVATLRNNGNTAVAAPFMVSFYKDAGLTQPIGSTTITPLVRGCAMQAYEAGILWQNVAEGTYQVWAKVDSQGVIGESQENDNTGTVRFAADGSANYYTLDVQSISDGEGEGGTVSVSPKLSAYPAGTVVKLAATPYPGWSFVRWTGALTGTNPEASLPMNSDMQVQAHFSKDAYTIDYQAIGNGQIQLKPAKETYAFGEWVTVSAIPARKWRFVAWSGTVEGNEMTTYFRVEQNASLVATFAPVADELFAPIIRGNP